MSWPNRITVFRLVLATPFILLLLYASQNPSCRYGAIGVMVLIGILDAADGIIARRTGTVTKIGSVLDPLADKALMITALVAMTFPGVLSEDPSIRLPFWVSITLVSRDIFILVGAMVVYHLVGFCQGVPSLIGKASTIMQFIMLVLACAAPQFGWYSPVTQGILYTVWIITVLLGILSWIGYIRMGSKLLTTGTTGQT